MRLENYNTEGTRRSGV